MEYGWDQEFESFRSQVKEFVREFKTPEVERGPAALPKSAALGTEAGSSVPAAA